jgi:putative CocE/NonD family hydrolase
MLITMADGCRLSARVWIPKDAESSPVPAILEHLPYRKRDGTIVRDQFTHPWMAGHGYACIRVDMRGNGDSEGLMSDEYTPQELQDACDVIAWAASQKWCNGKVGMMGISWGGFNGLQVAALDPPALKAVISICSTVDRYADDIHYKGGALLLKNFSWAITMLAYSSRPPDPQLVGNKWVEMWKERLNAMPFLISTWLRHQHRDDYWRHGSVCEDYSTISAAVLSIGGWHDGYRNTISHLVENLESPVKGIVGPWNHKYPHYAGPKPNIGFLQEAKRWWDKWLKDEDTGVENDPAYRAYVMDSIAPRRWYDARPGRWIALADWPSREVEPLTLNLAEGGTLTTKPEPLKTSICSPADCGLEGGEFFPFAFGDELPGDQAVDDESSACFDSEPLEKAMDLVGAPIFEASLSCDQPNGQIAVRLNDLRPDGTIAFICVGVLNLTHHASHETPGPLIPGKPFNVRFALDQIGYHIPAGHRLRVAVSTSWFPNLWPAPQATTLTLHQAAISVPVRGGDGANKGGNEWEFEESIGAPAWQAEVLRPAKYEREIKKDSDSGETVTTILSDFGENRDCEHGLISGGWTREIMSVHSDDPLSARHFIEYEKSGGRAGQMYHTRTESLFTSDAEFFYPNATLKCWLNEELIFEREWKDKVPRNLA